MPLSKLPKWVNCAICGIDMQVWTLNRVYCDACKIVRRNQIRPDYREVERAYARRYNANLSPEARAKSAERRRAYATTRRRELCEKQKEYARLNKDRINRYFRDRRRRDPVFRLSANLRSRIWMAVKEQSTSRSSGIYKLIGKTGPELLTYLLAHPDCKPEFTAENYGTAWVIDHIRPLAAFDLSDAEQLSAAMNFSNLRPLGVSENASKGSRFGGKVHRHKTHTEAS